MPSLKGPGPFFSTLPRTPSWANCGAASGLDPRHVNVICAETLAKTKSRDINPVRLVAEQGRDLVFGGGADVFESSHTNSYNVGRQNFVPSLKGLGSIFTLPRTPSWANCGAALRARPSARECHMCRDIGEDRMRHIPWRVVDHGDDMSSYWRAHSQARREVK